MKIKINLAKIASTSPSSTQAFNVGSPTYKENVASTLEGFVGLDLVRTASSATLTIGVGGSIVTLTGDGITGFSATGDYIIVEGTWTLASGTTMESLLRLGYISYDVDGKTALITYLQNSDNDHVTKSLIEVGTILGTFNRAIGLKRMDVDIEGYARGFNYVWVPALGRYYYVDSADMVTSSITRLHLKEDVLMSWASLIRRQTAYVERQENLFDENLIDERVSYSYEKYVSISSITMDNNIFANTGNADKDFVIETVGGN